MFEDWAGLGVTIVLTIIGIVISYFTPKRYFTKIDTEKARNARKEIESTLSRSIIQQGLKPSMTEIQRMIDSKAREASVSPEKIGRAEEIVEDIYTKIVETDFIIPLWKKRIVNTLNKILAVKKPKISKKEILEIKQLQMQRKRLMLLSITTVWTIVYIILVTLVFKDVF